MKFGIIGAMGRMGQSLARLAWTKKNFILNAAIESENNPHIKKDYGFLSGIEGFSLPLTTLSQLNTTQVEGLIDFSTPKSTLDMLEKIKGSYVCAVIGTTGFSSEQRSQIEKYAQKNAILLAPNMSLGVNILFWLVRKVSELIRDHDFDPEIIETHHKYKKDSPSGTAKNSIRRSFWRNFLGMSLLSIYGRKGNDRYKA